jgi:membrane-associated phospholipid phosphatase
MKKLLIVLLLAASTSPLVAQTRADSTAPIPPFFRPRDALIAAGFAAGMVAMMPLDKHIAHTLQDPKLQQSTIMRRGAAFFRFMGQPAPQIIAVGMYGVGRLAHSKRMEQLAVHGFESMVLSTAITGPIKLLAGRARPYVYHDSAAFDFKLGRGFKGTDFESFPSGHATTAFAVASAVQSQTWEWIREDHGPAALKAAIAVVMYGGASMVGVSRSYNNKHWASDVMAGAGIGTFSGLKVVTYSMRHPRNFVDRTLIAAGMQPAADGGTYVTFSFKF